MQYFVQNNTCAKMFYVTSSCSCKNIRLSKLIRAASKQSFIAYNHSTLYSRWKCIIQSKTITVIFAAVIID